MQVLVNHNTASASEIVRTLFLLVSCDFACSCGNDIKLALLQVATALHDNCRAILVGEKTYGKGLIQSVFELHDGSGVVVTIGKYATPQHLDINGNGVEPDFHQIPSWSEVTERLFRCNKLRQG
ncbi:hypothetical protein Dimus_022004 [Dionaea muscipula]